jgi:hypothetical protein
MTASEGRGSGWRYVVAHLAPPLKHIIRAIELGAHPARVDGQVG